MPVAEDLPHDVAVMADGRVLITGMFTHAMYTLDPATGAMTTMPIGVTDVEGEFGRGDVVACVDSQGHECARGLINYSSADTRRILRQPSSQIARILGSMTEPELMHRDNLVVL